MLTTNEISTELFSYLSGVAGIPATYYIDSTEQPLDDHIRAYIMPAVSVSKGFGDNDGTKQVGLVYLNIFVKAAANANFKSGDYAELLSDAFKKGTDTGQICFIKPPNIKPPIADNGFLMRSVICEYTIFT